MVRVGVRSTALATLTILAVAAYAASKPAIAPVYKEFLSGPTSYLLTKIERQSFTILKTDEERERFVERFWELRNPAPGSAQNEFKEEFYRRLAFVNAYYGNDAGSDGWRTDRGRTYLLFGKPQSTINMQANQELYPTELWFYSNPGLSELPSFFYVLFYDKDGIGGYRFYHPYIDGPEKITRAGMTKAQAYTYLKNINPELARATLTLIPGEPIDTDTYSGSMESGDVIRAVQGYSQMPSYVSTIMARLHRIEMVKSRVEFHPVQTQLLAFVALEKGEPWLHWQVEVKDPTQPRPADGRAHYRVTARLYSSGRLVFERQDAPSFPAQDAARPFFYEDRLPVEEGQYRLTVAVQNEGAGRSYEATRDFSAPGAGRGELAVSDLLAVMRFEPDTRERPFQFGGIKFYPGSAAMATALRGLRICYQIALPDPRPAELQVEYVIGNTATHVHKTFEDKLDLRAADSFGSLITGKTLSTDELAPGAYQLAVRVKDPTTGRIVGRSLAFTIADSVSDIEPVVISASHADTPQWLAANRYERALCWLAQGRPQEAVTALEASLQYSKSPAVQGLLDHLYAQTGRRAR